MDTDKLTPMRAIRAKCLDCSCQSAKEVRECPMKHCPLYIYRDGHNPRRKGIGSKHIDERTFVSKNAVE